MVTWLARPKGPAPVPSDAVAGEICADGFADGISFAVALGSRAAHHGRKRTEETPGAIPPC